MFSRRPDSNPWMVFFGLGFLFLAAFAARAEVTPEITFNDPGGTYQPYYADITSNLQASIRAWTKDYAPDVTLRVVVRFALPTLTTTNQNVIAVGNSFGVEDPSSDGTYRVVTQGAAARLLGVDLGDITQPDISLFINPANLGGRLWFDPDPEARTAAVPEDKIDAVTALTREVGHALGFVSFLNAVTAEQSAKVETTFDEHVVQGGANPFFTGAQAEAVYGGPVPLNTPAIYILGNEAPLPGSDLFIHYLMGVGASPGVRLYISDLERAILRDTGLDLQSPTVSLAVKVGTTAIGGNPPGVVEFSIPRARTGDLTIRYRLKGSAVAGTDYKGLSGMATIPAGATSRKVKIVPRSAGPRGVRTLKVIVSPGSDYFVGAAATARIKILAAGQ